MRGRWNHGQRGVTLVEFALVSPLVLLLLFGIVDFSRIVQSNSTVAEAARQGARQAVANAAANTDDPFGPPPYTGQCSGTVFTPTADKKGCLTDARIRDAVAVQLKAGGLADPVLQSNKAAGKAAGQCAAPSNLPLSGSAIVCIYPGESGSPDTTDPPTATCATAKARLGHDPQPGELGSRKEEWTNPRFKGCYTIQVTAIYTYAPFTGLLQGVIGNTFHLMSTTSMVAEY
jgi:hypothetical protein